MSLARTVSMCWFAGWLTCGLAALVSGQEFFERYADWPERTTLRGTLILAPNLTTLAKQADNIRTLLNGEPLLVVQPGPQSEPEEVVPETIQEVATLLGKDWTVGAVEDRVGAGCWLVFEDTTNAASEELAAQAQLAVLMQKHLARSGTLILVGPAFESAGTWRVVAKPTVGPDGGEVAQATVELAAGWGLLPDCALHMLTASGADGRSEDIGALDTLDAPIAQSASPDLELPSAWVDVQLSEDAVLVLRGRLMQSLGSGFTRVALASTVEQAESVQPIESVQLLRKPERGRPTREWLADLTQWRRRAMELTLEPFPPEEHQLPVVPNGRLLIVGGGGLPSGLMERFVELAGGPAEARLVYIPCSEEDEVPEGGILREWRMMGVTHVAQIHTKDRRRANTDKELLATLRQATGVWFGGGRQWNFADSYYGTEAHRLMKEVLQRGGVVGGSSAGASIQASYLARATPIGNSEIMAPGYERGGLGFITGVAIDQHFTQRGRHPDLKALVTRYPRLLGIGIDETTAIEVVGSQAKVLGEGEVYFDQWLDGSVQVTALSAGEVFDLAHRSVVESE